MVLSSLLTILESTGIRSLWIMALGLLSLYGHLSSMNVGKGQPVKRGDILGRTGQTGLAAGDHLHFSIVLQGVQVNPLEWWDRRWVEEHILGKLEDNSQ